MRLQLFRRLALLGALLAFVVVVLGAWVRLNAAGLGCPDWPGCYGHITVGAAENNLTHITQKFPNRPFEYAKAIKEMVHRYFASTLGLLCVALAAIAIVQRKDPEQPVVLPVLLVCFVVLQGVLGMWTVTLLLTPLIVTAHLLGGLTTLSMLAWLAMRKPTGVERDKIPKLRTLAIAAVAVLGIQLFLGGWTSSNYAALACPDFPTCQNTYWPQMDPQEAFVLWRGVPLNDGVNFEGGVLHHPARVAIHFAHRLGAVVTAAFLAYVALFAWRRGTTPQMRLAGLLVGAALVTQLIVGPVMVMRALPLSLATMHNAVAALLLLAVIRLNRTTVLI